MTNVIYSPVIVHGKNVPKPDIFATPIKWQKSTSFIDIEVSNMGTLRDAETKQIIWPFKSSGGYNCISVSGENYKVANIVAGTFIPNPENKKIVNHKNGVKNWDAAENLEWVTTSENTSHAINELGYINNFGKCCVDVIKDGEVVFNARSVQEAARFAGGKSTHVSQVCKGKRNHHKGYIFRYSA